MPRILVLRPGELGDSGLWTADGRGRLVPVDADEVGLSDDLADAIEAWVDAYDAALDPEAPEAPPFDSDDARLAWIAEGEALGRAAQAELGIGWQVTADLDDWRP